MHSHNALAIAALVCFGFGVGLAAGGFLDPSWAPRLGQCAPGSRGNVCIMSAALLGAQVQSPDPIAQCSDGSLSYANTVADACDGHGAVAIVLNDPALPAEVPSCQLAVAGTLVNARGPLCLSATPTP